MRVRWTTDAADDLVRICDFIAESPNAIRSGKKRASLSACPSF